MNTGEAEDFAGELRRFWDARDRPPPAAATGLGRVGRYRFERLLGRGGQGSVFLAIDETLGRQVAVKVLTGIAWDGEAGAQRFRREAELASRLDHPNLCTVYDHGVADGVPFLVMRYVEGRTLAALLDEERKAAVGALPTTSARDRVARMLVTFATVARALHAAHEVGVVHRDLKPGNLMIGPSGEPVVLDFGVASDLVADTPTLTRTGDLCGTPAYMSPEQLALHPREIDRRSDVFALGVCLYEAATLRRPFDAPTREGIFQAIAALEPTDPRRLEPAVSRDLAVVLATALAKDRERRYATALAFADDLARVRAREPIRARPASWWTKTARWGQRHPGVAASLSLLFLTLALGLWWTSSLSAERGKAIHEMSQLADLNRWRELGAWSDRLYPPGEQLLHGPRGMDAWLEAANRLAARRIVHAEARARLAARALPPTEPGGGPGFADDLDAVMFAALDELLAGLDALPAAIARMQQRRDFAASVARRSVLDAAEAWRAARAAVRSDPRFAGFDLLPQPGLLPLGADPASGLQEFAHLQTGSVPRRDPANGRLVCAEDAGLVFVLLPPGRFLMGAANAPGQPNHDPDAQAAEQPVRAVGLDAFLLSKFEMTQAQWLALMEAPNPSELRPGRKDRFKFESGEERSVTYTLRHPVEQVSWADARVALGRAALTLPTEAQWEYACRAATTTVRYTGDDIASLRGHANILDVSIGHLIPPGRQMQAGWRDGHGYHAPVGSFAANPWGLHDMHGNVWELCLDRYTDYDRPVAPGTGERQAESVEDLHVVNRSDCFHYDGLKARSAQRNKSPAHFRYWNLGLRPARSIDAPR